jgi:hypothetical protein
MSNKSSMNNWSVGYTDGYLQMIFGKKRKALKAKRKRDKKARKVGRK